MKLVDVYAVSQAPELLWVLLAERPVENRISHQVMPSREEHDDFVTSTPYRYWYLIEEGGAFVGDLCVTELNEIGVSILREHQRRGYGSEAINLFVQTHEPLPAIPAKRNARWLANIAAGNEGSKTFFGRLGFERIQETWAL